jgi:hypothetical protein
MTQSSEQLRLHTVSKFYLLDYFYILLKSIQIYKNRDDVFISFIDLKVEHKLGESKYKKLTNNSDNITYQKVMRYDYTMRQVISESVQYGLIEQKDNDLILMEKGLELIQLFENGDIVSYTYKVFKYMEEYYGSFRYHLEFCQKNNSQRNGLLVFPMYSPLKLKLNRRDVKTTKDIINYINLLCDKISNDIYDSIQRKIDFSQDKDDIIQKLYSQSLLDSDEKALFPPNKYNVILKRIRDSLIKVILNKVYNYKFSFPSFDIWMYRAKQIGILHATEFFPFNSGKIVFPTAILSKNVISNDFKLIYSYNDGIKLYIHFPDKSNENTINAFVDCLIESYLFIRNNVKTYYISLPDLKEIVCYKQRIPTYIFDQFLDETYRLILSGSIKKIKISLEADRLPYETNAMYLKREPSIINNRLTNIIGINIHGGD